MKKIESTITITYGDVAENHVKMQKIGSLAKTGFTIDELIQAKEKFEKDGGKCELILLHDYVKTYQAEKAAILIIRGGVDILLKNKKHKDMFKEQKELDWDKKAFMYGRVVNKRARYNLCYAKYSQEPDYKNKKGRIIKFSDIPLTLEIRNKLHKYIGIKAKNLHAEGNYYYDIKKCGIGFHGDSERKKVVAVRLGDTMPIVYRWYYKHKQIGEDIILNINGGDIYIMSEKATGNDWKKSSKITLRHAAGCNKFIK